MNEAPKSGDFLDPLALAATLTRDLADSLDIEQTTRSVLAEIVKILKAEAGALFLFGRTGDTLICHASVGPVRIDGMEISSNQGIVGRSISEDRIIATENAYTEIGFHTGTDEVTGFVTRSLLCAPLRVGGTAIGAVEVLNKIAEPVFNHQDKALLKVAAGAAALALNNARVTAQLVAQEALKREVELAAKIHRSLLPRQAAHLPVRGINRPARQFSGDFYDYFSLPDGKIAFALGDVSGKGMNAALLTTKTASLFRCLGKASNDPARLLTIINREIMEARTRGMFVTMIAGYFDPLTRRCLLANAGHVPALVLKPNRTIERYGAESPPLGILSETRFTTQAIDLTGSQLFLFSDGLNEWQQNGEEIGVEGVEEALRRESRMPLDLRLPSILRTTGIDRGIANDDVTMLILDATLALEQDEDTPADMPSDPESDEPIGRSSVTELRLSADPANLRLARGLLRAAAQSQEFSPEETEDILLAISEALENVIVHAYDRRKEGEIVLSLVRIKNGLKILIRDFADKADQAKIKPRDLGDIRPGGLGTHFIDQVMDKVHYVPLAEGEGNLLELTKRKKKRE